MAPPSITEYRATAYGFYRLTSCITDRKRSSQDPRSSQRYADFITTTLRASTEYLRHNDDQFSQPVSELRLAMKHTSLGPNSRPRHLPTDRNSHDRRQQEPLATRSTGVVEAGGNELAYLLMDWKEDDEEHERPCYWSLLKELNRDLQFNNE